MYWFALEDTTSGKGIGRRCLILCLLFCLSAPSHAVTIQFWHSMSGDKGKLVNELVSEFNRQNTSKITATVQFIGTYEEGLNKTRTALLAKRGPHVVQITDIGTQVMLDTQHVIPLQDFIDKDAEFPIKEILPQLRRYYEIKGRLNSLPFATSNPIIYYNVDAFEKAGLGHSPRTFSELADFARKLTDAKKKITGITWPLHSWFFEEFLAKQGQELINMGNGRSGRATEVFFTSPAALEFVNLWRSMVNEGTFANVGRGWEPAEQNFLAQRSAMLITSTSDVFEVIKKAPFRVMTAPLPTKDPKVSGGTIIGGNSLWILKGKPNEEVKAGYELVKFMASKIAQRRWHTNTGYFPIRLDLIAELEKEGFYKKYPAAKTAIDQLRASADISATRGALMGVFPESRVNIETAIEQILTTGAEPVEALSRAKDATEQALKRYNRGRS